MKKLLCCCMVLLALSCKEKYDAPVTVPATGYLVIEGYISAQGPAELHLSRTIPLSDTARMVNEAFARVQLQGRDNTTFNFTESAGGMYKHAALNLNRNMQYRLYIKTTAGKEYASEYVNVRIAPPIDSVGWFRLDDGVQLYINSHDPNNNTWYYRWTTEQTWEFTSSYYSSLEFSRDNSTQRINGVKWRYPDHSRKEDWITCWKDENSSNLILGSSAKLSKDSIHRDLVYIPPASWKLSVLYSLMVKQYALSKDEYDYFNKMKKNSEETGSIFGNQPSELKGNVHCLSNPNEPVIGYIGIANRQEKRIWIRKSDVPGWRYYQECFTYEVTIDSAEAYAALMPTVPIKYNQFAISSYLGVEPVCVNCTLRGTNSKPSFWP